jgi:hypothetical protein
MNYIKLALAIAAGILLANLVMFLIAVAPVLALVIGSAALFAFGIPHVMEQNRKSDETFEERRARLVQRNDQ